LHAGDSHIVDVTDISRNSVKARGPKESSNEPVEIDPAAKSLSPRWLHDFREWGHSRSRLIGGPGL